jgi:hypothetical protein
MKEEKLEGKPILFYFENYQLPATNLILEKREKKLN